MLIFIIGLIVWGFIVGALARLALPGPDPMPWYATIGLGLAGSLVGGIVAHILLGVAGGLIFAVLGAPFVEVNSPDYDRVANIPTHPDNLPTADMVLAASGPRRIVDYLRTNLFRPS